ncbi:hypothetical protein [Streptomyces tendae]
MRVLLDSLASGVASKTAAGSPVSEQTINEATRPLADAGWEHTVDGHWIRWQAPGGHPVGVQFDAFAAQTHPSAPAAWTFWAGDVHTPSWTLHFSPHAAALVLHGVAFEVANGLTQTAITARTRHHNVISHAPHTGRQRGKAALTRASSLASAQARGPV